MIQKFWPLETIGVLALDERLEALRGDTPEAKRVVNVRSISLYSIEEDTYICLQFNEMLFFSKFQLINQFFILKTKKCRQLIKVFDDMNEIILPKMIKRLNDLNQLIIQIQINRIVVY